MNNFIGAIEGEFRSRPRHTLKEAEDLLDETHPNCSCGLVPHEEDENGEES